MAIDQLLKKYQLQAADLSYIACGIGPGSFTGTRLAVTTAQVMGYALNKPLITFLSLQAFLPDSDGFFCSATLSGSTLYSLEGKKEKGGITFAATATTTSSPPYPLISPDAEAIQKRFQLPCKMAGVNSAFLAKYTYAQYQANHFASTPITICYCCNKA